MTCRGDGNWGGTGDRFLLLRGLSPIYHKSEKEKKGIAPTGKEVVSIPQKKLQNGGRGKQLKEEEKREKGGGFRVFCVGGHKENKKERKRAV